MTSFINYAESSASVRHAEPMVVRDSLVVAILGTFRDNGEMFVSFYLNLNLPELTKSKWGTNITWSPAGMNFPTKGKSIASLSCKTLSSI